MAARVEYRWRGALTDTEMTELVRSHGGRAVPGWWDQIRPHSLGWVTARLWGRQVRPGECSGQKEPGGTHCARAISCESS